MKKRAPLIGLNCSLLKQEGATFYRLNRLYIDAIRRAGGMPVVLPTARSRSEADALLDRIDGLVLTGGNDIHPRRWGGRKHPKAKLLTPEKENSDFLLAEAALKRSVPTLGICLGSQVINVALGGSLHQHLPDVPGVTVHRKSETTHDVDIVRDSRLGDLLKSPRRRVNSLHHQGIARPGRGLRVTAVAPDGVTEALEGTGPDFLLAIQWHPERLQDRPEQRRLFDALVSESRHR